MREAVSVGGLGGDAEGVRGSKGIVPNVMPDWSWSRSGGFNAGMALGLGLMVPREEEDPTDGSRGRRVERLWEEYRDEVVPTGEDLAVA